jgi:hypothetical protein
MSISPVKVPEPKAVPEQPVQDRTAGARGAVAWSSFFLALLQSVCTFLVALSGLRLVIGVGSLALSAGTAAMMRRFHADWIRLPMIGLAVAGSVLNLVVLWQIRHMRSRPAAQWRAQPVNRRTARMERVQLVLSVVTLVLVAVEESLHFYLNHHV